LRWTEAETELIDKFCALYNAVVFNDPASNFHGHYRLDYALNASQSSSDPNRSPDLLIHVGEMSDFCSIIENPKQVWRISPDGKIQDRYHALSHVFEMPESYFFQHYNALRENGPESDSYLQSCLSAQKRILSNLPQLPFSHLYVASKLYDKLPKGCTLHLGILSPLRSWGYFPLDKSIEVYCNEGGFGIDGNMSSLLGASLACPDKLFFGVVGDLSFFYDMNVLGNRHIQCNFRILLINNSLGAEFHLFKQLNSVYVNNIDWYLSAGNHFGNQSPVLVKHYAENLGYEYLSASSKQEFIQCYERFITPELTEKPMIFEIFTQVDNENEALKQIWNIEVPGAKTIIKQSIKKILGDKVVNLIKEVIK
jgi:2-succinyl-6-hydroxy-2,4-cyclohexadiene-1-carboxylate synthase